LCWSIAASTKRRRRSIFGDAVTYAETVDELAAGLLCAAASRDGSAVAREESVVACASRLARCFNWEMAARAHQAFYAQVLAVAQ
jgi:hypothetical protein